MERLLQAINVRCVIVALAICPKKAITLLGNQVTEQCQYEKYYEETQEGLRTLTTT